MTRQAWIAALATFVFASTVPAGASAFSIATTNESASGSVMRWADPDVAYYLDPADAPGVYDGSTVPVLKQSFQDWQDVACSSLAFQFMGTTSNKSVLPVTQQSNNKNELVWTKCSSWGFGDYVLGVTLPMPNWSGNIVEADIAFNGCLSWNTKGEVGGGWGGSSTMDVKSVAIHEIGHLFGLQHVLSGGSTYDPPTMEPAVDYQGRTATLSDDDKLGACFLYPSPSYYPSGYYTCKTNADCPRIVGHTGEDEVYTGSLTCKSGYCNGAGGGIAPGSVVFGGTCSANTDCISPDGCVQLDSGIKMCTHKCDVTNDTCPTSTRCAVLASGAGQFCVPGAKKKLDGEACTSSYECASSFCFPTPDGSGMFCRTVCNGDAPCPDGMACWTSGFSATGGCFPKDQVPVKKKPLDTLCAADAECSSGLCWSRPGEDARCRRPCDPAAPECYSSYYCQPMNDGRAACIPGDLADGQPCEGDEQCAKGHCETLITTGTKFCRSRCDLQTWACDWGLSCISYGTTDYGICMPSLDKKNTGEVCGAGDECLSTICRSGESGSYCTQNCLAGWCPENMHCEDTADLGPLCVAGPPAGGEDVGPGNEDEGVTPEDLGTPLDEDVLQGEEGTGGEEAEAETETETEGETEGEDDPGAATVDSGRPGSKGGGCSAGVPGDPAAALSLILVLGSGLAARRRRW